MAGNVFDRNTGLPHIHQVSWGSVIAGAFVALVSQILLSVLGLAIGLTAINPATQGSYSGIGIGSGVWFLISTFISVFLGAWTASWWANDRYRSDGMFHGVLTWSLFLVISLVFIGMGLGTVFGGAMSLLSSSISGVAQNVSMSDITSQDLTAQRVALIQERLSVVIPQPTPVSENMKQLNLSTDVQHMVAEHIAAGDDAGAVALIQQNTNMTQTQARQVIEQVQIQPQDVAQRVTDTGSKVAWWTFSTLFLSLIAALIGGRIGSLGPRHTAVGGTVT